MKKIYLIAFMLLAGCATPPAPAPRIPLTPAQQEAQAALNKAAAICRFEAAKSTQRSQTGRSMSAMVMDDINAKIHKEEVFNLCMQAQGYSG